MKKNQLNDEGETVSDDKKISEKLKDFSLSNKSKSTAIWGSVR